jgi:hypothetical protein
LPDRANSDLVGLVNYRSSFAERDDLNLYEGNRHEVVRRREVEPSYLMEVKTRNFGNASFVTPAKRSEFSKDDLHSAEQRSNIGLHTREKSA